MSRSRSSKRLHKRAVADRRVVADRRIRSDRRADFPPTRKATSVLIAGPLAALPPSLVPRHIKPVSVSGHSSAVVSHAELHRPDVILLPADLSGYPLSALLRRLRARVPKARILVVSKQCSQKFATTILRQGAAGCIQPTSTPAALAQAILAVKEGDIWLERRLLAKMLSHLMPDDHGLRRIKPGASTARYNPPLTDREMQVAALVGKGFTNKEIAKRLSISEPTVRKHLEHIYAKLGVHSRTEVALRQLTD